MPDNRGTTHTPNSEFRIPNSKKFDPITLEILWRRLVSIVDEADASVARTAFSSLLRDAHDYTCMFTDSRGQELVQGTFCTPGQAGAMALGVKKLINSIALDAYQPGDVFIVNDPWLLAGHLNDVCVMSPIFYKERPVAFTACVFHHSDIGGRVASDNRQVYEEGLYIPPLKLYEAGVLNDSVLELIRWNVRTPEEVTGDIRSQVAANHVCAQKVIEMLEDEGLDTLDDLADEIKQTSCRVTRCGELIGREVARRGAARRLLPPVALGAHAGVVVLELADAVLVLVLQRVVHAVDVGRRGDAVVFHVGRVPGSVAADDEVAHESLHL